MLFRLIRATGFKRFVGFVSPAFFEVVPAVPMLKRARTLLRDYRDERGFQEAAAIRAAAVDAAEVGVHATTEPSSVQSAAGLSFDERKQAGEAVLRLFFHQLFTDGPTLLDLSAARFRGVEPVEWAMSPGHVVWSPPFVAAVRRLYIGFYREDPEQMRAGLSDLGLESAEQLFRRHFGEGDQSEVLFTVDHFVSSFHDVFTHCKKAGIRLDPDFLALGIYLATLYENLESSGVPFDVRRAFDAVVPTAP